MLALASGKEAGVGRQNETMYVRGRERTVVIVDEDAGWWVPPLRVLLGSNRQDQGQFLGSPSVWHAFCHRETGKTTREKGQIDRTGGSGGQCAFACSPLLTPRCVRACLPAFLFLAWISFRGPARTKHTGCGQRWWKPRPWVPPPVPRGSGRFTLAPKSRWIRGICQPRTLLHLPASEQMARPPLYIILRYINVLRFLSLFFFFFWQNAFDNVPRSVELNDVLRDSSFDLFDSCFDIDVS